MAEDKSPAEQDEYIKVFCKKSGHFLGKIKKEENKDAHFYCSKCGTMNDVVVQVIKISGDARH